MGWRWLQFGSQNCNDNATIALTFMSPLQVIKEHDPAITSASLKAMTYLEVVMKETQRRYPIVAGVFRKALRDFELPGGCHVPKASPFSVMSSSTRLLVGEHVGTTHHLHLK